MLQCLEVQRKEKQLAETDFELIISQKQFESVNIDNKIKSLNRERDVLSSDSENRIKLAVKKTELENQKKKLNKMSVHVFSTVSSPSTFVH